MHRARAASTPGDQPYRRSLAIIPQLAPHHEPVAAAIRTGDRKRAAGRPPRIFLIFGNGPKLEENHRQIHSPRYPFGFRTKGCVMDGSNSALSSNSMPCGKLEEKLWKSVFTRHTKVRRY